MDSSGGLRWRRLGSLKPIQTKKGAGKSYKKAEEDEQPLSPSARLFHEPDFNVHVTAIMGGDSPICPRLIKDNLVLSIQKHPRFSSLHVTDAKTGEMKWVRTKVDIEKHVLLRDITPLDLEQFGSPEKILEEYVYNLTKSSLDKSKPLWELHILNLESSEIGRTGGFGIFRIHHSLGDGTSLMSLLLACTRQVDDPEKLPTIPGQDKNKKKILESATTNRSTPGIKLFGMIWECVKRIWFLVELMWNTLVDVVMFGATTFFLKDTDTPIKALPGSEFRPRRIVFRVVSLDDMKLIKNVMKMTINDVALGVTQAGLSRYLNRRYAEEKGHDNGATEKNNNLPKNIRLRSTLLINLRPSPGIQALADMMEKDTEAKWGNWIGFVLLPFKIELRDDPLDYVREAKSTIDRKKRSLEAVYTFSISELVLKFLGIKASSALSHKIITRTTMCFSNLVGPQEEIGFYGHKISYLASGSYGQPHALMINYQSYASKMSVVLSVDESVIPDPHQLLDDIQESLQLIKDAAIAAS
ncbi:OLC1v1038402C1 [Oldenlandia corymbosa var. corymbosa]|uniref:OLC1v1038402C1 n=1 Tax=Oldenlandia corymbosa var. corymbosa TaxID=529605 RepID=A0AAV1D2S2_OLDCO|nr:OLC1v1038402C1 [Oldenlandia corymbosa var. corymbosa]